MSRETATWIPHDRQNRVTCIMHTYDFKSKRIGIYNVWLSETFPVNTEYKIFNKDQIRRLGDSNRLRIEDDSGFSILDLDDQACPEDVRKDILESLEQKEKVVDWKYEDDKNSLFRYNFDRFILSCKTSDFSFVMSTKAAEINHFMFHPTGGTMLLKGEYILKIPEEVFFHILDNRKRA